MSILSYVGQLYFSKTELNFRLKTSFCQFLTWLLPDLRKMLTSIISNTGWCHSVGVSCNFMDTFVVLGNICDALADVIAMLPCLW